MILKIEVTKNCNQSCLHCSFSRKYSADTTNLTLSQLKTQITNLKQRGSLSHFSVILTGGEPLLNPELFPMVDYLHSQGASHITLATNAIPLMGNDQMKRDLKTSKINELVISLSTSNQDYESLRGSKQEPVMSLIQELRVQNPKMTMTGNYLLHRKNLKETMDLIPKIPSLPFDVIRLLTYDQSLSPKESPLLDLEKEGQVTIKNLVKRHNDTIFKNGFTYLKRLIMKKFLNHPMTHIELLVVESKVEKGSIIALSA